MNKKCKKEEYSLLAKRFVKKKASESLNITFDDIIFDTTVNGKPYIKTHPEFHFNISHTAGAVAVAFGDSPIGVDIEKIRKVDMRVAKRFFTESEKETIKTEADFFKVWTKKEAYIKKNGLTISSLRYADSQNIHTIEYNGYIISVSTDSNEKNIPIILENSFNI